ncbi:MAG: DUF1176 domain-containing protein [Pseudomonadota bacterium]
MTTFSRSTAIAIALSLIATLMLVDAASANQFKRIRDVNVACNNALRCDLFIVNPAVSLYNIGLRRSAARDADVSLFMTLRQALAAGSTVSISIDGRPVVSVPASDLRYRAANGEYSLAAGEAVDQFVLAAAEGREMRVTYRTNRGQTTATYSLSGFIAGVIFMDEVQGRIGAPDALQLALDPENAGRGGNDDGLNVDFRVLNRVPAGLVTYYNFEDRLCGQMDTGLAGQIGGFELSVEGRQSLVAFPCTRGGAYNQPFSVFQRTGSSYVPSMFPVIRDGAPGVDYYAYNLEWDADAGELSAFFKGRGVGDCGQITRWAVDASELGIALRLVSSRVKDECDGEADLTAPEWVSTWPTETAVQ